SPCATPNGSTEQQAGLSCERDGLEFRARVMRMSRARIRSSGAAKPGRGAERLGTPLGVPLGTWSLLRRRRRRRTPQEVMVELFGHLVDRTGEIRVLDQERVDIPVM